jgi:glucan 1,3-beta-glucosidase
VIAIELVNEPFPRSPEEIGTLEGFYRDGYDEVRKFRAGGAAEGGAGVPTVLLSEAYQSLGFWSGFMPSSQYNKVALDVVSVFSVLWG